MYDDFVRISSEIMKGRNTAQQRSLVRDVLVSLLPPGTAEGFRCVKRTASFLSDPGLVGLALLPPSRANKPPQSSPPHLLPPDGCGRAGACSHRQSFQRSSMRS